MINTLPVQAAQGPQLGNGPVGHKGIPAGAQHCPPQGDPLGRGSGQQALARGESLLICPDQDYASTGEQVGQLYSGFLHLERPYCKATGRHLPFVPLCCRRSDKTLVMGRALSFTGEKSFRQERDELARALTRAMNELAQAPEAAGR